MAAKQVTFSKELQEAFSAQLQQSKWPEHDGKPQKTARAPGSKPKYAKPAPALGLAQFVFSGGKGELSAADAAVIACENKLRESFGAGVPAEVELVDFSASYSSGEAYNTLHFPTKLHVSGPPPDPLVRETSIRIPMVDSQAEFANNLHALTLGLCETWKDLPLFMAGGCALAAAHRWPAVQVPDDVACAYAQDGEELLPAKFAREFVWKQTTFSDDYMKPTCEIVPMLSLYEGTKTYGLQYSQRAHLPKCYESVLPGKCDPSLTLSRADRHMLGLMSAVHARFWVSSEWALGGVPVGKFLDEKGKPMGEALDETKVVYGAGMDPDVVIDAVNAQIKKKINLESCEPCSQHLRRVLERLGSYSLDPSLCRGRCRGDRWRRFEAMRSILRIHHEPKANMAALSGTGEGHFDASLYEPTAAELVALFPAGVARLCQDYVGLKASEVFAAGLPRARALRSLRRTDVDLFLITRDADAATKTIVELHARLVARCGEVGIVRTENAITFVPPKPYRKIQVILRLYHSPGQVLLGFDLDCCAVGAMSAAPNTPTQNKAPNTPTQNKAPNTSTQNKAPLWRLVTTARGARALATRQNIVDPTRLSSTYEARLYKYMRRGIAVAAPGLTAAKFDIVVNRTAALHRLCATREGRRRKISSFPSVLVNSLACGVTRLVMMLYVYVHNRFHKATPHTQRLERILGFRGGPSDYDDACHNSHERSNDNESCHPRDAKSSELYAPVAEGFCASSAPAAVFAAVCSPSPLAFRTTDPHGQGRPSATSGGSAGSAALFTGSFNPIFADWYHLSDLSALTAAVAADD